MTADDVEETTFNTKPREFEYLVILMEACNALATFQTSTNQVFHDFMDELATVYIDDLLIFSKEKKSQFRHFETELSRLQKNYLYAFSMTCEFLKDYIDFLGMLIGEMVNPNKSKILISCPRPSSPTDIPSFFELLQIFRRFIPNFAKVAAPLTDLTKKGSGVHNWDEN